LQGEMGWQRKRGGEGLKSSAVDVVHLLSLSVDTPGKKVKRPQTPHL